jgi:predicted 3-demethylubiquinone-9 3-methyltransferase (glyoxalase superfamily)
MTIKQKISPCLWFDTNAQEAVDFYSSIFKNSRTVSKNYYGEGQHLPAGTLLSVKFELDGQEFTALNGGPIFKFTEAISLMVYCESQAEIDELWEKLIAGGGQHSVCGWLKDRFGLSWQIVPAQLEQWTASTDQKKAGAALQAVMKMKKLIVADIEKAYKAA